jgi:hypothetical protein
MLLRPIGAPDDLVLGVGLKGRSLYGKAQGCVDMGIACIDYSGLPEWVAEFGYRLGYHEEAQEGQRISRHGAESGETQRRYSVSDDFARETVTAQPEKLRDASDEWARGTSPQITKRNGLIGMLVVLSKQPNCVNGNSTVLRCAESAELSPANNAVSPRPDFTIIASGYERELKSA